MRCVFLLALAGCAALAQNESARYQAAQTALNEHRWQDAADILKTFAPNAPLRDSALYWQAFALARLGRGEESAAAIDELRRSYPTTLWAHDAKALEAGLPPEVPVYQEYTQIDDLRLLARRDPKAAVERATEIIEQPNTQKFKDQTILAIEAAGLEAVRPLFERVGRGQLNPSLAGRAQFFFAREDPDLLVEIYRSSKVIGIKSYVDAALANYQRRKQLAQIAREEPDAQRREVVLRRLISSGGDADAAEILRTEASAQLKQRIGAVLADEAKKFAASLAALRDASSNPAARSKAALGVALRGDQSVTDLLASVYRSDRDPGVREAAITALGLRQAYSTLEALGREETDLALKRKLVETLMRSDDYVRQMWK
jgi:hypothetical protein